MSKSWELTDEQKREIQEKQRQIAAEYDPETGKKKGAGENTGDDEDVEGMETRNGRRRDDDDENIR